MLLAGDAQRSFRHTNRRANLCQIQRPAGVCIQEFLEPGDDHVVAAAAAGHSRGLALGQAPDHHKNQLLLQCPSHLGKRKNIRSSFGELSDHVMNLQQP